MKELLTTERLLLRKIHVSDSESLFSIWSDPDVTKYMNIDRFTDVSRAREMIELLNHLSQENKAIRYSMIKALFSNIVAI
jgi:ribosomal-protein-alanine N-acetyltransferase